MSSHQTIGKGKHVLLTGGNGFVASHILKNLMEYGYQVTATVRSEDKAEAVYTTHPDWKDHVKFEYVADITKKNAFDHLFEKEPFDFILHTSSPVAFKVDDIVKDLVEPAIYGTIGIMESAHKLAGPTLKRIVLLGSAVSVLNTFEDKTKAGKPYTEDDWNPVTRQYAVENNDVVSGYNVSKIEPEQAAWKFMEKKPTFDLVVINPDIITGPMIHPISGAKSVNETNRFAIYDFLDGTHPKIEDVRFPFYHFVDVRDVARAHVDALTNPSASGKRILMISGLITPQLVVNTVRKAFPQLKDKVPEGTPEQILPENNDPTGWDLSRSMKVLSEGSPSGKWEFIDLEKSLVDAVQCMIDVGIL
ncbi:hypothetical protein FSARC_9738 [Fusarium sarcochroum]|uniref:NAD-dependent epimerase/dehydratase domain-containing protein n=1 Tax=Fusarium sarcochroum TaxID=1208366 RepID=A0A8H4X5V7_9HYPO|nr:hypothetical protein FSARC_9738 [Fusarium sarcochroum]